MNALPEIKNDNGIPTLYVKGKSFFSLCGELHNSSASNLEFLEKEVFPKLKDLNLNSIITPIYWEQIEQEEGKYDFSVVEGLIQQARKNNLHIILLWFGLWKNAESMYVPKWMKKDSKKYFRVETISGEKLNSISPFCEKAVEKDALAFSSLMKFVKKIDEAESTVIMAQVENEIGLLGTDRDYSSIAEDEFNSKVPEELQKEYEKSGNWESVFSDNASESFMAYHYAKAVEKITQAGVKAYNIPYFTNAWLKQYPWYPGSYPSGGPIKEMHKIWKITAPSLFTLAPDIYVPFVSEVMEEYSYEGNPLLIPEIRKDAVTSSYCLHAFTKYNAICYSPFGIEDLALHPDEIKQPPMEVMIALNIDPEAFNITNSKKYLSSTYKLIDEIKPILLNNRGKNKTHSFLKKSETDFGKLIKLKNYDVVVSYKPKSTGKPVSSGVIIELEDNKFLILGMMYSLEFRSKLGDNKKVEILKFEEGSFKDNVWEPGRVLNGDEKMSINFDENISCKMIELYKY